MHQLTIQTTMLQLLAQRCATVASSGGILAILQNVKIIVNKNLVTFVATDMETSIECRGVCASNDDFSFLWGIESIIKFCSNVTETTLTIKYNPANLLINISTITGEFEYASEAVADFPQLPSEIDDISFDVTDGLLDKMKIAAMFTSSDTLRPSMTGVCFDLREDHLYIVGCDMQSLYLSEPFFLFDYDLPHQCVVPAKTIKTLGSFEIKGAVKVSISVSHVKFESANINVYARLIDAKYPDYNAIIPVYDRYFTADLKTLQQNVGLVSCFADNTTNQIVFTVKAETVELNALDVTFSKKGRSVVPIKTMLPPFIFSLNGLSTQKILKNLRAEAIVYSEGVPSRALIFKDKTSNDIFLLMPLLVLPSA